MKSQIMIIGAGILIALMTVYGIMQEVSAATLMSRTTTHLDNSFMPVKSAEAAQATPKLSYKQKAALLSLGIKNGTAYGNSNDNEIAGMILIIALICIGIAAAAEQSP